MKGFHICAVPTATQLPLVETRIEIIRDREREVYSWKIRSLETENRDYWTVLQMDLELPAYPFLKWLK